MRRRRIGDALLLAGLGLLVGSLAAGAAGGQSSALPSEAGGPTLVGIQGGGPSLHAHGSVTAYDAGGNVSWRYAAGDSFFDVTELDDETILAGFMAGGRRDCAPHEPPCARTGFKLVRPGPDPRIVREHSFPVRTKTNSETHDVERLPSGNFLYTDMEHERLVIVTPDGDRVWMWNASARYDAPPDPTLVDWLHINDVDRIDDGRYLVSVRNQDQLLVVERGRGVVEVINAAGDEALFNNQHNPQWLSEDAILVADSANDRIVELHRNGSTWEPAWVLYRADGVRFDWPRDADRLPNGNTLITDSRNRRIVEVNASGDVVWRLRTEYVPYEADRLPAGETVGGPRYVGNGTATVGSGSDPLAGLAPALALLRQSVALPLWFSRWHLLSLLVSLALGIAGAAVRRSY